MSTHNDVQKIIKKIFEKISLCLKPSETNTQIHYLFTSNVNPFYLLSLSLSLAFKEGKTMYCVTFSEKKENYHVNSWGIPQEELSLVIHHVIF